MKSNDHCNIYIIISLIIGLQNSSIIADFCFRIDDKRGNDEWKLYNRLSMGWTTCEHLIKQISEMEFHCPWFDYA